MQPANRAESQHLSFAGKKIGQAQLTGQSHNICLSQEKKKREHSKLTGRSQNVCLLQEERERVQPANGMEWSCNVCLSQEKREWGRVCQNFSSYLGTRCSHFDPLRTLEWSSLYTYPVTKRPYGTFEQQKNKVLNPGSRTQS